MTQPGPLQSEEYLPWSRARGVDVWAIFCAAAKGDLEAVKALVARDPGLIDCEFEYRKPVYFAVRDNRPEVVEFLLDNGADPTYTVVNDSLLTMARDRGYDGLAELLEAKLKQHHRIDRQAESIAALIRARDIAQVRERIKAQPGLVHVADERGNQPIHWAVMTRQMELIDFLLDHGADINSRRPDGARPLNLTNGDYWYRGWRDVPPQAMQRHHVLIGYLIARGSDYDINVAAKIGDLDRVRALLDQDPLLVNNLSPYSAYSSGLPLRGAAAGGHLEVVKLLLERGADPNQAEPEAPEGGALRDAVGGEHYEIAKLLLEHGANPNASVESSGSCIWAARKHPRMFKLLASYGGVIRFDLACYDGDVSIVGAMLAANPSLDVKEDSLHYAAENGHDEVLALIHRFQPGTLKRHRLGDPKTPELARWLLERGVDPNRPNWLGITPMHRFAAKGRIDLAEVLLESGAGIDPVDEEYCSTPLGWAARSGREEMVIWLLAKGADPALPKDKPWAVPVEWAKRRGHEDIVAALV